MLLTALHGSVKKYDFDTQVIYTYGVTPFQKVATPLFFDTCMCLILDIVFEHVFWFVC